MALIDTLRKYIFLSGKTAREIAAGADMSRETVYNILDGRVPNPSAKTVRGLEKVFGTRFEEEGEVMLTEYDIFELNCMNAPHEDMTHEEREEVFEGFHLTEETLNAEIKKLRAEGKIVTRMERLPFNKQGRYRDAILEAVSSGLADLQEKSVEGPDGAHQVPAAVYDNLTLLAERLELVLV